MAKWTSICSILLLSATCLFVYLFGSYFDKVPSEGRSKHYENDYFGSTSIRGTCTPARNIVFIKVPKCGGSTITNVFQRYGEKHSLRFLFPKFGDVLIKPRDIRDHIGDDVNLIVNHVQFIENDMRKLMPRGTVYIGVLRNPLEQLKSLYNFAKKGIMKNGTIVSLADFEENPWKYQYVRIPKNQQSSYYGHLNKISTSQEIEEFILHVDSMFNLILITDHMKESIVLLGELLCWTLDDMLYVSQKVAADGKLGSLSTTSFDHTTNRALAERNYRIYSKVDYAMFEFFNKTLWRKIKAMGRRFEERLGKFDALLDSFHKRCKYTSESLGLSDEFVNSVIKEDSDSDDYLCHRMLLPSPLYIKYILRPNQNSRLQSFNNKVVLK
ncbi:unnamed protein product [Owenia fusiformis]|uniref:Uncharacterized protein n=1 Tax=Owenia fusiformis TaxID=6347 RepID=A0A8J1YDM4_OWEFU|nr:unnamed protein product [Owenia fusiformis]